MRELLDLILRWVHVVAGIMWIGNSLLFNWLDRNLTMPERAGAGVQGQIWLVHSGAFYDVVKKQLAPHEMPPVLHWFKWQSYTTWMSGVGLLVVVYYTTGGAFMVDPNVRALSPGVAVAIGAGTLVGGFIAYDLIWRSPLARHESLAALLCVALLTVAGYLLLHALSGRAAYLHVAAMMGSIMSGNVFLHIVPSQRELVAATMAGQTQDLRLSLHAKRRSIHNNYMTFPVLVLMVSNHYPSLWGAARNGMVLAVLIGAGAAVRHVLNVRFTFGDWIAALAGTVSLAVGGLYFLVAFPAMPSHALGRHRDGPDVPFATVQAIVATRCMPCHGYHPTDHTFPAPPVRFESPQEIRALGDRIFLRAVVQRTMPLMNRTGMTRAERDTIDAWYDQGGEIDH